MEIFKDSRHLMFFSNIFDVKNIKFLDKDETRSFPNNCHILELYIENENENKLTM